MVSAAVQKTSTEPLSGLRRVSSGGQFWLAKAAVGESSAAMGVLRRGPLEGMVTALVGSGVVCPQPAVWNRLWSRIKAKVNDAEPVPMPLILAVWHSASDQRKTERFIDQLMIAQRYGLEADLVDVVGGGDDRRRLASEQPA